MMLFKLSLKNITKSIKDYAIYFFTLILGVSIFYVFNAIDSQTVLLDVTSNTYEIIKLMTNMLSGVSVFVSFILGFLIIYASRFLIKRRNKEFGIYLTLGMSKRKISLILFFETLIIGLLSLVVGLGIGVCLSQLMSILVANMFEADMTKFQFVFSTSACIKTLIYFGIMYLLVMLFNTINISKCKLIDLLHASKKTEKVKLKNPVLCTIIFIISCIVLGYAYYLVTGGFDKIDSSQKIFIPIILGAVSTFFIFWSISGLLLKIFMSMKRTYYKGLNSFILRQFSSKINTTVFSMTIICLMLFVTICVLSASLSIKNSITAELNELSPVDIQMEYSYTSYYDNVDIFELFKQNGFDLKSNLKEYITYEMYQEYTGVTIKDTLGSSYESLHQQFPYLSYDDNEDIMKVSDYNKIARLYGIEEYTLNNDEYIIISNYESMVKLRNVALENNQEITIEGRTLKPKYNNCQDGFVEITSTHSNTGIILVPDDIEFTDAWSYKSWVGNYKTSDKEEQQEIQEQIYNTIKIINSNDTDASNISFSTNTKLDIIEASVGLGALVTFIGLYLGIIFLISSAAILALKELSESTDNKERYAMLRKIGTDEKMINKALFTQIAIFFAFPLLIAIIHSIFGLKFSMLILEIFGSKGLLESIIMTTIFLVVIYGGYFLITYLCSKNIIKERY